MGVNKVWRNFKYRLKFIFFKSSFSLNNEKRNENVIVSLTSFPARIDKVHLCLKSLLLQKVKPDKIILYLGAEQFPDQKIPVSIENCRKYGVEIVYCEDIRPHKKYFFSIPGNPNSIVITVDDDILYSPSLVEDLLTAYNEHKTNVICTRAHLIRIENKEISKYNDWEFETKQRREASHYLLATGVGGVLYPPHVLPSIAFNKELIKTLCLDADDIWLKAMELLNNIKVFAIDSRKNQYTTGILGAEKKALNKINVGESRNDAYISQVFSYFNITTDYFEK